MNLRHLIVSSILTLGQLMGSEQPGGELPSPHVISFFFKPSVPISTKPTADELVKVISNPGPSHHNLIYQENAARYTSGIFVLYAGRITYSDADGKVMLPRLTSDESVTVVVTERITPVIQHGNTVSYFKLKDAYPASYYQFTRTLDETGKKMAWNVKRLDTTTTRVPSSALIILTLPTAITIEEGIFPTNNGPNLILPNIRVNTLTPSRDSTLAEINVSRFFAPLNSWFANESERYAYAAT